MQDTEGVTRPLKALILDASRCTSCLQCEMACSQEHEGIISPTYSRIKVFEFEHGRRNVPYTCTQCEEAWCLHACPTDAISVDVALGIKSIDESRCVGCRVCTIACPYGTVNMNTRTGKAVKCNLCGGDPKCSEACPTGAIRYDIPGTPAADDTGEQA